MALGMCCHVDVLCEAASVSGRAARQAGCQDTARRCMIKSNCYSRLAHSRCGENCAAGTVSFILICCLMRNNGWCGDAAPS